MVVVAKQYGVDAQAPAQGTSVVALVLTEEALSKLSLPRKAQQLPGVILLPNGQEVSPQYEYLIFNVSVVVPQEPIRKAHSLPHWCITHSDQLVKVPAAVVRLLSCAES